MEGFKRAFKEGGLCAAFSTVFSLFAVSLFAVFVRAYAPSVLTIAIADRAILCAGNFVGALLFIRPGRALLKGGVSGALSLFVTALVFGFVGGFHFTALFLADLLLAFLFGGLGALLGAKIRKE